MSSHAAAFDICNTIINADTGAGGLNQTGGGTAFLYGGFGRVQQPQRTQNNPYIWFEIASEREVDAMPNQRVDMVLRFHIYSDRNTMFTPSLPGSQDEVAARLRTVFHRVVGGSSGGWTANMIYRIGGQQAPSGDTDAHYVETYHMRMSR